MRSDKEKLKRKNAILASTMAVIAVGLYVIAIYFN